MEEGTVAEIPVVGSREDTVPVYCTESYTLKTTPAMKDKISVHIVGPRFVYQNQAKGGQLYGTVQVRCENTILFESPLFYANSVEKTYFKITVWQRLTNWLRCLLE